MSAISACAPACTAFSGDRFLAAGSPAEVALAVRRALDREAGSPILTFDDASGKVVDFDLRGSDDEIVARLAVEGSPATDPAEPPALRGVGRPKLGVVAREVTLLPRHWEWLAAQPGGASVALRRLVDSARNANREKDAARAAQAAADRFMQTMLGDKPGYEAASRALYAGDAETFRDLSEPWPADLRDHARRLAVAAFVQIQYC